MDLGPAARPNASIGPPRLDPIWLEPCPAAFYGSVTPSPASQYESRQSVALAFLIAIQLVPAKQRAVLILRDVLGFQAAECAALLDLTVASINSALQRARETLATREGQWRTAPPTTDHSALLAKYVQAWEHADVNSLVALLLRDATLAMPPLSEWLAGADGIGASIQGMLFGPAGPGVFHLIETEANGAPAFAAYQRDRDSGQMRAMAIHVIELREGLIASITAFLDPSLFALLGLPAEVSI
jgi:RNA polymerase sigma-70 factor (ECF subfamily)